MDVLKAEISVIRHDIETVSNAYKAEISDGFYMEIEQWKEVCLYVYRFYYLLIALTHSIR